MGEPMTASDKDAQTAEKQERGYWLYVPGEGAGKWEEFRGGRDHGAQLGPDR